MLHIQSMYERTAPVVHTRQYYSSGKLKTICICSLVPAMTLLVHRSAAPLTRRFNMPKYFCVSRPATVTARLSLFD